MPGTGPPLDDRYAIDDDPARVDREVVWRFLSREAYWGRWRDRAVVDAQMDSAWRVVAAYGRADGRLVGFARAVSDGAAFGYLADVFVLAPHRGLGLGHRLVAAMVDDGPGATFRWLLHTADAHGLYRAHGFVEPNATLLERPARR